MALASSLQPLWQARGRLREGLAWFDAALADLDAHHPGVAAAVRARALADQAVLAILAGAADSLDQAQQALAIAREVDDPALLARALTACGLIAVFTDPEVARAYFAEAIGLARALGDRWRLSQLLGWQASRRRSWRVTRSRGARPPRKDATSPTPSVTGTARAGAAGRLGVAQIWKGDLVGAAAQFSEVAAEAEAAHDEISQGHSLAYQGVALAYQGDTGAARAAADAAVEAAAELGAMSAGVAYSALATAALAAGDVATALDASEAAWPHLSALPRRRRRCSAVGAAQAALAGGDLVAARRWADDAVATTTGWHLMSALTTRARVAIALGEPEQAERDAHDALAIAASMQAYLGISDTLECLAVLAGEAGSHREAARLFGAAHGIRERMGAVRFKVWDAGYEASVAALRDAMGDEGL